MTLLADRPVCLLHGYIRGVFETAYLLTTPTNYDVKLSKRELSKRV